MGERIRGAQAEDLAALQGIERAADEMFVAVLGAAATWSDAPSGAERAADPGFLLVAGPLGDPVGFAHVVEVAGRAHLEQLSVHPRASRRGIGRALVEAAVHSAAQRGSVLMSLRTFADVPWNAPFYASCGFVAVEPLTAFDHGLIAHEERLGLLDVAPRVLMVRNLRGIAENVSAE